MKKLLVLILSILLGIALMGCDEKKDGPEGHDGPWDRRPAIMVDGEIYLSTGELRLVELDPGVVKDVTNVVSSSQLPAKEGEINFPMPEAKYAKINDGSEYVVVLVDLEWEKFEKEVGRNR